MRKLVSPSMTNHLLRTTREQAVSHIREAIHLYLTVLEEDHLPIPEEKFDALLVAV